MAPTGRIAPGSPRPASLEMPSGQGGGAGLPESPNLPAPLRAGATALALAREHDDGVPRQQVKPPKSVNMAMMKSGQILYCCLSSLISWPRIRLCTQLGEFEMILLAVRSCMIFISLSSISRISGYWFARHCEMLIRLKWFGL
jgi:hypothetical protein